MLVEIKDISNKLFMLNSTMIAKIEQVGFEDKYELTVLGLVEKVQVSGAMLMYLQQTDSLSMSVNSFSEERYQTVLSSRINSKTFPVTNPKVEVTVPENTNSFIGDTVKLTSKILHSNASIDWTSIPADGVTLTKVADGCNVEFTSKGVYAIKATLSDDSHEAITMVTCKSVNLSTDRPSGFVMILDRPEPVNIKFDTTCPYTPVWTSSNEEIGTYINGMVHAKKSGSFNLVVTLHDESITIPVIVEEARVEITNPGEIELVADEQVQLVANVSGLINKEVYWKVTPGHESIVSVTNDGIVTGKADGTATVTAYAKNYDFISSTKNVKVVTIGLTIPETYTVAEGENITVSSTVTGTSAEATYVSSDPQIASVGAVSGVVEAHKVGSVVITAYIKNVTAESNLTVEAKRISLDTERLTVNEGQVIPFTTSTNMSGTPRYSSNNNDIISINERGVATANKNGNAIIYSTLNDISATCSVTVRDIFIYIPDTEVSVGVGKTIDIVPRVSNTTDKGVWTIDTPIATISGNTFTGVAEGVATATFTVRGRTKTITLTVTDPKPSITLETNALNMYTDSDEYLSVTTANLTDPLVVSIDNNLITYNQSTGRIVSKATAGVSVISFTSGSLVETCTVTIMSGPIFTVTDPVGTGYIELGKTYQIQATVSTNEPITYASRDSKYITVSPTGLVTCVAVDRDFSSKIRMTVPSSSSNGAKEDIKFYTMEVGAKRIDIGISPREINVGETAQVKYTTNTTNIVVTNNTPDLVTLDPSTNILTAIKAGYAEIEVSGDGASETDMLVIN